SSEPYLRRLGGMMVIPGGCRNHSPSFWSSWALRARPRWTKRPMARDRLSIRLLLRQDPVRRLGEMPGHGPDGLGMAFPAGEALVEPADMASRIAPTQQIGRRRGFHERPLEVAVDVRAEGTVARLPARGADPRRRARIAGQPLGTRKAGDVA